MIFNFKLLLLYNQLLANYIVSVVIENKAGISDPEGDTILNDLVLKGKFKNIKKISSGTILKFLIVEKSKDLAKNKVMQICDELRIYNPLVSQITATVKEN